MIISDHQYHILVVLIINIYHLLQSDRITNHFTILLLHQLLTISTSKEKGYIQFYNGQTVKYFLSLAFAYTYLFTYSRAIEYSMWYYSFYQVIFSHTLSNRLILVINDLFRLLLNQNSAHFSIKLESVDLGTGPFLKLR